MAHHGSTIDPTDILEVAVYPPLGIARVGNADGEGEFFTAAEVIGCSPAEPGELRNADGKIKRQAVRFRIYARLCSGAVRELTLDDGVEIAWHVTVANLKAGWYEFNNALDLPESLPVEAIKRNADTPAGRFRLDITPAPRTISGRSLSGDDYVLLGKFFTAPVYLGELRTDAQGRLLFLGGRGLAAPLWPGAKPTTFANNTLWHDDTSDGPVRATVIVGGKPFEAKPGYVAVAPPNYAPGLFAVVTMDDVARDLFCRLGWMTLSAETTFTRDIWPIFSRLTAMQWVNHGLFMSHGFGSPLDAGNADVLKKMTDASQAGLGWRKAVLSLFRDPTAQGKVDRLKMPYFYGDAYSEQEDHAQGLLAVTVTMYRHLLSWSEGSFVSDWQGVPALVRFDDLPPEEQIEHLARAPLYECLGGPFHPGIELTWIMRHAAMWQEPYRLKVLAEGEPARQDFGQKLTPEGCLAPDGPLKGAAPGSLTRWLGVPWHTDEASCQSAFEYSPSTYLSMPSYWGARVPNQVLSAEAWSRAADDAGPALQRLKHAAYREDWTRDINGRNYFERIANMVESWWTLGMLVSEETPAHLCELGLPEASFVEHGRQTKRAGTNDKVQLMKLIERIDAPVALHVATLGATPPEASIPPSIYDRGEI